MIKILVVNEDPAMLLAFESCMSTRGHEVVGVRTAEDAMAALDGVDVVISDYSMPEVDGLQILERIGAVDSTIPVIIMTARGSEQVAVRALKHGAYDYVAKPFDQDEVMYSIERAAETHRLRADERTRMLEQAAGVRVVGQSPALARVIDAAMRVASRDVTVLVRGETGTGKEILATLLHARSARAARPLVVFNSAAIPRELAEAQLFGHAKGAFTGAIDTHVGYFAQADGGTLFLDEIGELPLDVQAKLLRVLQENEIQPLGSSRVERIDTRVIAATNRDLLAEVKAGRFREDLYYRINVVELVLPPLRDRAGDIPLLAREFARKYSERFALAHVVHLAPELIAQLEREPWPGNVRQLENTIARCVAMATSRIAGLELLERTAPSDGKQHIAPKPNQGPSFREQVEAFERTLLRNALVASNGNQSEAARRLQLQRASLYDKLKKYGIAFAEEG
jgi:two-component system, NtrC family, response regulator AtoC